MIYVSFCVHKHPTLMGKSVTCIIDLKSFEWRAKFQENVRVSSTRGELNEILYVILTYISRV